MDLNAYRSLFERFGAGDNSTILAGGALGLFPKYEIHGLRLCHWLGQFAQESRGFTDLEENLSYSAERLCKVWPTRFPTLKSALPYARNPEALANKVYSFRMGNDEPGDGWRYRGRGPQLTGKENYGNAERRTGLPLLSNPDLAAQPENFVLLACDYWDAKNCNQAADADNLVLVTKRINGGSIGIQERRQLVLKAKSILGEA
jgi:putative chitinase